MASEPADVVDAQPLAKVETQPLATVQGETEIGRLLNHALDKGIDTDKLEKLVELYERMQDREAAKEFAASLADFQAECPSIEKTSTANIVTRGGTNYSYAYAELDAIATVVRPFLHTRGLSYAWDCKVADRILTCTCTLRHVNGHSVSADFPCSIETSAAMSEPQKAAAALTFARRQSLVQVLGLTMTDPDNDGAGRPGPVGPITEERCRELNDLLIKAADAWGISAEQEKAEFLKHFSKEVETELAALTDIPANWYKVAVRAVTSRLGGAKE